MDLGLRDKGAIVAAASQGMGKTIALELAREGAKVAICSRRREAIESAAEEIRRATGAEVLPLVADVRRREDIERLVESAVRQFGRLDVLVNNAGGPPPGSFGDFDDDDWAQAFNLTLLSVVRLIRAVLPHMRAQGGGRIVNVASLSVKQPIENLILSNAIRPGVIGLAKSLSFELAKDNILINNVCPGRIATNRVIQTDSARAQREGTTLEEITRRQQATIPLGRYGTPEEFASMVAFLASARASYITGATIQVDGGLFRGLE
ncbi:MAG: SDR family oxidoreductase [Chloroflexi bacterium]|nr:SDR family oxidoreductase [Chloroflexota bacterium]